MGVNKFVYGNITKFDLTSDTVTAATLQQGYTAHGADGEAITGTLVPGGGAAVEENDVNFWDYDGTLVASYTAADFASLSALPSNPSHTGLTAQGWNWELAAAKTYVAAYGGLDVGQMYVTSDGKTRLYCHFESQRMSPYIRVCPKGTISIDWGDGSTADSLTGTSLTTVKGVAHTYAASGDYTITITPASGTTFAIYNGSLLGKDSSTNAAGNRVYLACIRRVELGPSVTLGQYAFQYCVNLESIAMASTTICNGRHPFQSCDGLKYITIPTSVTTMQRGMVESCVNLAIISMPKEVTTWGIGPFASCNSLRRLWITPSMSSYSTYGVQACSSLRKLVFPPGGTSFGSYFFTTCESLQELILPSTVTTLDTYCLNNCYILPKLTIPASVTTINSFCFQNMYGLKELHFKPTTPPAVANANAFTGLPTDCVIYVPTGKLSAYTSAQNYPSSASYTYVEE